MAFAWRSPKESFVGISSVIALDFASLSVHSTITQEQLRQHRGTHIQYQYQQLRLRRLWKHLRAIEKQLVMI
jgi:hypothetical protein